MQHKKARGACAPRARSALGQGSEAVAHLEAQRRRGAQGREGTIDGHGADKAQLRIITVAHRIEEVAAIHGQGPAPTGGVEVQIDVQHLLFEDVTQIVVREERLVAVGVADTR